MLSVETAFFMPAALSLPCPCVPELPLACSAKQPGTVYFNCFLPPLCLPSEHSGTLARGRGAVEGLGNTEHLGVERQGKGGKQVPAGLVSSTPGVVRAEVSVQSPAGTWAIK